MPCRVLSRYFMVILNQFFIWFIIQPRRRCQPPWFYSLLWISNTTSLWWLLLPIGYRLRDGFSLSQFVASMISQSASLLVSSQLFLDMNPLKRSLWMCSCTIDGKILFQVFEKNFWQTCLEKGYYVVSL